MTSRSQVTGLPEDFVGFEIKDDTQREITSAVAFLELARISIENVLTGASTPDGSQQAGFVNPAFIALDVVANTNGISIELQYSIDNGVTWNGVFSRSVAAPATGYSSVNGSGAVNTSVIPTGNRILLRLAAILSAPDTGANTIKRSRCVGVLLKV